MEITLIQGIMLAIAAIIIGIDYWLEAFFIFRPLIVSTITGLILGDVTLGLKCGALIELAFAGLTPAGGTQPPNPVLAGFMGTVLAYTTGSSPEASLGLALPFSVLMQYVILAYYSGFSFFMGKADRYAETADARGLGNLNLLMMGIVAVTYGVVVFLCAFVAQDAMKAFVESLPTFITHGLEVAGGILPAIGFGMLLRVMMKTKYIPYFLVGFLVSTFVVLPNLLPIALLGTAFALLDFFTARQRKIEVQEALEAANKGGSTHAGI